MTFSIVIPSCNGERFVCEAIKSACRQERPADEIVISDDGSSDNTIKVCQSAEFCGRIQIFRSERSPSGFVNAWNAALRKANCDYVTLLHQDDVLHPAYLKWVEQALVGCPQVQHVYAACNYIDAHGQTLREAPKPHSFTPHVYTGAEYRHNYLRSVVARCHIHRCPGVTTSRRLLGVCGYREEAGHIADDDFFYRVSKHTEVIGISEPLAGFRHHLDSETGKLDAVMLIKRLARDYVFQSSFHATGEYFGHDDIVLINMLALYYIDKLLYNSVLACDESQLQTACTLMRELRPVLQCGNYAGISKVQRVIWFLVNYARTRKLLYLYGRARQHFH